VFRKAIRTSTIDHGSVYTDKYPKFIKKVSFKIIIGKASLVKTCQICLLSYLPKILPKTDDRVETDNEKLPKISKIKPLRHTRVKYFPQHNYTFIITIRIVNPTTKIFIFSKLLRAGDVEQNPGPDLLGLSISTYNARGLKNVPKLKRILNSCYKKFNTSRNSFVFLQETHLEEADSISMNLMWRHKYILSPGTNRQCGCIILYDPSWDVIEEKVDEGGRFCLAVLEKNCINVTLLNIYAPNNHDILFFTQIFNLLIDTKTKYPDTLIMLSGDFNFVLSENDSVNRNSTQSELQCRNFFKRNIERLELIDAYRFKHLTGGFTWARGNCMSRLDMTFVSTELCTNSLESNIDWAFDDSDHAMLQTNFKIPDTFPKGPGLMRVNTEVLDDDVILDQIRRELDFQISQIPDTWDPHFKLDFIKSALRGIIAEETGKKKKLDNTEELAIKEQINTLKVCKEKLNSCNSTNHQLLSEVEGTINVLESEHRKFLDQKSKNLCLRAQTKWFEEGERSNKYFLNIIKKRVQQKTITELHSNQGSLKNQNDIMKHITEFYSELYNEKNTNESYDDLLSDCPSLSNEDRTTLDREITLEELKSVLNECKDSAPGPDGIPYKVYKKLWPQLGAFLLDAWKYSFEIGKLPSDQRLSIITLLPKEGKDLSKIENWRPITLTNCDLKIFTKLLADRVSGILDKVIHPCQTAYIPGRVVHDNLRLFDFYSNYCKEHNVDALLISLDAKKAFDSVSHKYMHKVLETYGFSQAFIDTVKLLYKDIKAQILVNGYKSTIIKILRSVKQGDALSCALFILCIDPLIRKLENHPEIAPAQIEPSRYTNINIKSKVGGFADDIGLVVKNEQVAIDNIFKTYSIFSNLSGIELNVGKTEILKLNQDSSNLAFIPQVIKVENKEIHTKESIKICGITFSSNKKIAYESNIVEKIRKMEKQLIIWLQRNLSLEGKNLIVKTFGLSQLIYSLQISGIEKQELVDIERMIFKFLWNKKWVGNMAPDRIKRDILKQDIKKGGLQVPDIAILNKALKIKQFVRSMSANHPISLIQRYHLENLGYYEYFKIEYANVCKVDPIVSAYQEYCNWASQYMRSSCSQLPCLDYESISDCISVVASTDVLEYLMIKNYRLIINMFSRLSNAGIVNYYQLFNESRFPRSDTFGVLANNVLQSFPRAWRQIVASAEVDCDITYEFSVPIVNFKLIDVNSISVKLIRQTLLENLKVHPPSYLDEGKYGANLDCTHNPFVLLRRTIHPPKDRFFKYRILLGDIFCGERLFKFKMKPTPFCDFCMPNRVVESIKHIIWDCPRSKTVWDNIDNIVNRAFDVNYINYNTIITGSENPIFVVEKIIIVGLKLIMTIERTNVIASEMIYAMIKKQFILEQKLVRTKFALRIQWEKINNAISLHRT